MPKKGGRKSTFGRKSDDAKKVSNWRKSKDINEVRKNINKWVKNHRRNESEEKYQERLENDAHNKFKTRINLKSPKRRSLRNQDAESKRNLRLQESPESYNARLLADATRQFERRIEETEEEHMSRILKQKERQKQLRSEETEEKVKERQDRDTTSKVLKRSLKADAYVNSFSPNDDWKKHLNKQALRQRTIRDNETPTQKQQRKSKDSEYHVRLRSEETEAKQNERKQKDSEYHHYKRIEDENRETEKRLEQYKFENLQLLHQHGSYFRFLHYGEPRQFFYGRYVYLHSNEEVQGWIFLENQINNEIMTGDDFYLSSTKIAAMFKQLGILKNDVVHLVIGNVNIVFGILGGLWQIGATCSISVINTEKEAIKAQLKESNAKLVICSKNVTQSYKDTIESMKTEEGIIGVEKVIELEDFQNEIKLVSNGLKCEPIIVDDIRSDICLIFWKNDENGIPCKIDRVTHADAFLGAMNLHLTLRGQNEEENSFFEKSGILLPLIALERKKTYVLQKSKETKSFETSDSLYRKIKEYSFKRPKITVTMQELENDIEDEDEISYENESSISKHPVRVQPKRSCQSRLKVQANLENDSDSTDDEILDEFIDNVVESIVLEGIFSCQECPYKCKTKEELKKHDDFYHQPWPISNVCDSNAPSSSGTSRNIAKALSNDSSDSNEETELEIENNKNLEEFIDQRITSAVIDRRHEYWEVNSNIKNDSNENENEREEIAQFLCRICNSDYTDQTTLEDHIQECFENCNMYDQYD